jgi:hypothetical protein
MKDYVYLVGYTARVNDFHGEHTDIHRMEIDSDEPIESVKEFEKRVADELERIRKARTKGIQGADKVFKPLEPLVFAVSTLRQPRQ